LGDPRGLGGRGQSADLGKAPEGGRGRRGAAASGCGRPWRRPLAPGSRGRPRRDRAPRSRPCGHEICTPGLGKAFGPVPAAARFPDVSRRPCSVKHRPPVGVRCCPRPCAESRSPHAKREAAAQFAPRLSVPPREGGLGENAPLPLKHSGRHHEGSAGRLRCWDEAGRGGSRL
jgi:hypothetical protein